MRVAVRPAYAEAEDWSRAVAAGNEALLDFLASEPAIARASIVEVLAAGPTALEQRDLAIKTYAERLREGFELTPEVPTVATEAISFGRYALLERHIVRYGPQALPRLGPALTFFVLAPFLGSDRAALVANESVRRAPGSPDIGGRRQLDLIRRPTIGPFEAHRIAHD
jgi:hypothetical protein